MSYSYRNCRKSKFAGTWGELKAKDNHGKSIWDKLCLSCEIGHYVKSLISIFQESFARADKILIFGGRHGLGYHSMELWDFSSVF